MENGPKRPMKTRLVGLNNPAVLLWTSDVGFGTFTFYEKDGKVYCDNEYMDRESVKDALMFLADSCIMNEPPEPGYVCQSCGRIQHESQRLAIPVGKNEDGSPRHVFKCCECRGELEKLDETSRP